MIEGASKGTQPAVSFPWIPFFPWGFRPEPEWSRSACSSPLLALAPPLIPGLAPRNASLGRRAPYRCIRTRVLLQRVSMFSLTRLRVYFLSGYSSPGSWPCANLAKEERLPCREDQLARKIVVLSTSRFPLDALTRLAEYPLLCVAFRIPFRHCAFPVPSGVGRIRGVPGFAPGCARCSKGFRPPRESRCHRRWP